MSECSHCSMPHEFFITKWGEDPLCWDCADSFTYLVGFKINGVEYCQQVIAENPDDAISIINQDIIYCRKK